jgi:hypothetical protein
MLYNISPTPFKLISFEFSRNNIILTDGKPDIVCLEPLKEEEIIYILVQTKQFHNRAKRKFPLL